MRNCRENLKRQYEDEFKKTLFLQAIDKKDRYSPKSHEKVSVGDVVLLKEDHTKFNNYPLAIVHRVVSNSIDEVTGVEVLKGNTREIVKRDIGRVIPLMEHDENTSAASVPKVQTPEVSRRRSRRIRDRAVKKKL